MVLFSVTLRNPCFPGTAVVGMPCRFHGSAGLFTVFWKGLLGSSPGVSAGQEGVLARVMMAVMRVIVSFTPACPNVLGDFKEARPKLADVSEVMGKSWLRATGIARIGQNTLSLNYASVFDSSILVIRLRGGRTTEQEFRARASLQR